MKKRFLFITLVFTLLKGISTKAQELKLTKFDWLRGQKINNFVQIKLKNNVIKWRDGGDVNDVGNYFTLSTSESLPTVFRAKKKSMNLKLNFFNPVLYSVSINEVNQEDALFKTTTQFTESLVGIFNTVSTGIDGYMPPNSNIELNKSPSINSTKSSIFDLGSEITPSKNLITGSLPPSIANWFLWYDFQRGMNQHNSIEEEHYKKYMDIFQKKINAINKSKEPREFKEKKIEPINASKDLATKSKFILCVDDSKIGTITKDVLEADSFLHGKFKINSKENFFLGHIKSVLDVLTKAYDYNSLRKANDDARDMIEELKQKQKDIEEALKKIESFDPVMPNENEFCSLFKIYTQAEFKAYVNNVRESLNKRTKVNDQILELVALVEKYLNDEVTREISVDIGKMKQISISFTKRNLVLDNENFNIILSDKAISGFCVINQSSWAVPEVAGGLAYPTKLTFSQYDIDVLDNNQYQIVDKGAFNPNVVPGVFMNFIFDAPLSPGVFPIFQLGIGSTNDNPTLMAGVGIRFYPNISVTIGKIGGFEKQLTTYKVGDLLPKNDVGKMNFQNSLKSSFIADGIYLGIQWKL